MSQEPLVRARYMQTFLDMVERLPDEDARAIRSTIGETVWNDVRRAGGFSWLPIQANLLATHAVATNLDSRRTHEFFRGFMLSSFETPLLSSFINAVTRVAGPNPARYLEWVSKGFNILFKNCGTWRVVERDDAGTATIEVEGLPRAYATDRTWLMTVSSALHALFTVAKCEGAVTIRDSDEDKGRVAFRLRWTPG